MKNTGLKSTWTNPTLYIYSNIINLKHFPKDFCQIFCNGDGPACTSHPVATLLRLWKDGSWHHQHQWRTMRRMLLRLRKDGYRHHPHHRLKFSMGLLGRGFYASPSPGSSWNDTGDSPSPLLWAAILDWCSVMMRLCLSNILSRRCLLQFQLLGWWLPHKKTLQITAGAPLSTVFERRYPALIWGVAAEDRVVGDEEANVEDRREEMKKVTGGDENTHGGNAAISGAIWGRKTGWATPSASKTPRRTNHHHLLQHCGIVSNLEIWTNRRLWTISNLHHLVP